MFDSRLYPLDLGDTAFKRRQPIEQPGGGGAAPCPFEANGVKHIRFTKETVLAVDIDGTLASLKRPADDRIIDGNAFEALKLFHQECPNQVIPMTARDRKQIKTCFDKDLSIFPNILSNGAELTLPDGSFYQYPFSRIEQRYVDLMHEKMDEFQIMYPCLLTEKKSTELVFHKKAAKGQKPDKKTLAAASLAAANLFNYLDSVAKLMKVPFKLTKNHELTYRAISNTMITKADSPRWFAQHLPTLPQGKDWSNVIFCGDGFQSNDREMAEKVRARGGVTILVTNGHTKNIPAEGDRADPHMAVSTPEELGCLLKTHVMRFLNGRKNLTL